MFLKKIKNLSIPNDSRIIVISDIHGELQLLKELLEKINFSDEDYLIINGDLCEKGSNSKGVIRYVMGLTAFNNKVHVTEGNCECIVEKLLNEDYKLINYLCNRKRSLLNEWLEEQNFFILKNSDVKKVKHIIMEYYSNEIKWINNLPTAIETDNYIFVHAGLEDIKDWKKTNRYTAITMQTFLRKSHQANKFVIVGHYPVINYNLSIPNHNPIIDKTKKIISIDGGNVIKKTGQLNAFIIKKQSAGDNFSYAYADKLPTYKVTKNHIANPKMIGSIRFPLYDIIPIVKGKYFTFSKQLQSEELIYVKNEYIEGNQRNGFTVKDDVSCSEISVDEGEIVKLINSNCKGFDLIKKDGKVGWIPKNHLIKC